MASYNTINKYAFLWNFVVFIMIFQLILIVLKYCLKIVYCLFITEPFFGAAQASLSPGLNEREFHLSMPKLFFISPLKGIPSLKGGIITNTELKW